MSVPKHRRTESKLEVQTKAKELAKYTTTICANEKVFPKRDRWIVTNRIVSTALTIMEEVDTANDIYVSTKGDFELRRRSQTIALSSTSRLLGLMESQLVQLLVLDKLDHYIKEELRIKHYVRYMDDFILIHHDKCYLAECRKKIDKKIRELGLLPSPKKTQLFPVVQSIKFLGFKFVLTETGKVLMLLSRDNIKKRKRKIRKDKKLVLEGRMTRETADNKYRSWRDGHAKKGNSYKMLRGMDEYYKKTWDDIEGSVA